MSHIYNLTPADNQSNLAISSVHPTTNHVTTTMEIISEYTILTPKTQNPTTTRKKLG